MAKLTREQRDLLDRKLEYVKAREKRGGGSKTPIDYGVTKEEFLRVLEKVTQPIKEPLSDSE